MKYKCPPYNTGKLRIGGMYDYPLIQHTLSKEEQRLQSALMRWDKGARRERRVLRVCVAVVLMAIVFLIKE